MAVSGIFTSNAGIVGERAGDFSAAMLRLYPTGNAPLYALTSGMETADARDTIVTWFEEQMNPGRYSQTNSASTGATLIMDDASHITAGVILMSETSGEYVFVEGVTGNTVTVTRGFSETSIVASDGSGTAKYWQRIGTAFEEASSRPAAVTMLGYPVFNYTQIFRNAWDVSGTARKIDYITGDKVAKSKADCGQIHAEDIERSLWWSRKSVGIRNSKPFRTMDGIIAQIKTNVSSQPNDGMTKAVLDSFIMDVFSRNIQGKPNERIAFCGNTVVSVINQLAEAKGVINLVPGATAFGMKVTKWMTPFGDISLMTHPLFNLSPVFSTHLYILHPGAIRKRYLRRTMPDNNETSGTRSGVDADYGTLTTELTIQLMAERTSGVYTGIDEIDAT